jgi:hypothetical protein
MGWAPFWAIFSQFPFQHENNANYVYVNHTQQHCYVFPKNLIAMFFLKTLSPCGIRTLAFCSSGGCVVRFATLPGPWSQTLFGKIPWYVVF